ncbi:HAD-IA family hydrolase [Candidatus Pacearchaeota archaeon]|nr:HAD-IA family hydrolase [Candidatus Pacearchaeota archaeon]
MVKAILFDWGGVLGKSSSEKASKIIYQKAGLNPQDIVRLVDEHDAPYLTKDNDEEYYQKLSTIFNESIDRLKGLLCEITFTDLYHSLGEFGGYDIYLLSNQTATRTKAIKKVTDFSKFRGTFFSDEMGLKKPDRKYYELVLKHIGLPANECLFIDDKERNTEGAKKIGMHVFTYKNNKEELLSFLKQI